MGRVLTSLERSKWPWWEKPSFPRVHAGRKATAFWSPSVSASRQNSGRRHLPHHVQAFIRLWNEHFTATFPQSEEASYPYQHHWCLTWHTHTWCMAVQSTPPGLFIYKWSIMSWKKIFWKYQLSGVIVLLCTFLALA